MNEIDNKIVEIYENSLRWDSEVNPKTKIINISAFKRDIRKYITGLLDKVVPKDKKLINNYDKINYYKQGFTDCQNELKQNIAKLKDSNLARDIRESEEK